MSDVFTASLDALRADVDRVRGLLRLVTELRDFASEPLPTEGEAGKYARRAYELGGTVKSVSAELPLFSGTLLLYLAGRFEHFVRSSFEAHADAIAAKCERFSQLPLKMQVGLKFHTAEVMTAPAKFGFDEVEVAVRIARLASNLSAEKGIGPINSDCLSLTQNNLRPELLGVLYQRVGMLAVWSEIAKQAPLKTFLELQADAATEKEAKSRLDEMMSVRNSIAHPEDTPTFPGPDKVLSWCEFVVVLSETLTSLSRASVAAFRPRAGT